MADSNITVSGLMVMLGSGQNQLAWNSPIDPNANGLPYLRFAATEIWKSNSNDRNAAQYVGETSGTAFVHMGVPIGSRFFYWIKPRDQLGLYGEWFPVSGSGGIDIGSGGGTGQDVVRAVLQPDGFIRHDEGWVEEWGQAISQSLGVVNIAFQTSFTEMFGVSAIANTTSNLFVIVTSLTTTGVVLQVVPSTDSVPVYWRVFGK